MLRSTTFGNMNVFQNLLSTIFFAFGIALMSYQAYLPKPEPTPQEAVSASLSGSMADRLVRDQDYVGSIPTSETIKTWHQKPFCRFNTDQNW